MFKRTTYAAVVCDETPFHRGRQEWDDRIGSAVIQARNWRLAAILALVACLLLSGGIVYTATTIRTYPYVIEVAETGQVRTVGKLVNPAYVIPDAVKVFLVRTWIEQIRSLAFDTVVVRQNLDRAWAFAGDRVRPMIRDHVQRMAENAALPEKDGRKKAIVVAVQSVLPVTENTYRVDWTEQTFSAFGQEEAVRKYGATMTLKERAWSITADMTKQRDQYPLGVYLYDLSWTTIAE